MTAKRAVGKRPSDAFLQYVLDQLGGVDGVRSRSMFGGYGLYRGEAFFGIVFRSQLYFKTDAATREKYEAAGSGPLRASAKQTLKNYFEVPADILDNRERLAAWAVEAAER